MLSQISLLKLLFISLEWNPETSASTGCSSFPEGPPSSSPVVSTSPQFSLHNSQPLYFHCSFLYTRSNHHLSPWVRKTSSPLHYHPQRLLRLLSSSWVTQPKPAVMNLNTACLWSQYHNAYFSEISSSFSTTLWSLSRSEAQKTVTRTQKSDESSGGQARFAILYEWHSTILFLCYLCFSSVIPDCFAL